MVMRRVQAHIPEKEGGRRRGRDGKGGGDAEGNSGGDGGGVDGGCEHDGSGGWPARAAEGSSAQRVAVEGGNMGSYM